MRRFARAALIVSVACAVIQTATATPAGGRNEPLPLAEWLVDLARDQGLRPGTRPTATDVARARVFLQAALRIRPDQPDALGWLWELQALDDDTAAANATLAKLVAADPGHQAAYARWLAVGREDAQTVDARREWLEKLIAPENLPADRAAMVHVELARLALQGLDAPTARQQMALARTLDPYNPDLVRLEVDLLDDQSTPAQRLATALAMLEQNPFQTKLSWDIALLLDKVGLPDEAATFYGHAQRVYAGTLPAGVLPVAEFLLDFARNCAWRGQLGDAAKLAEQAVVADSIRAAEAGLFWQWVLRAQGRKLDADEVAKKLRERFKPIADPATVAVNELAQAAWFGVTVDAEDANANPQRALMLAESAAQQAPEVPFVQRVLGWALAMNHRDDEARRTLAPLAKTDPFAAYRLACLLRDAGDEVGAVTVVAGLEVVPPGGPARELLDSLRMRAVTTRPAGAETDPARAALAKFDRTVLEFAANPGRFVQAEITFDDRSPAPGEPWWATFALTNLASFPITLGPNGLFNPVFLLSFAMEGDRQRDFPNLLPVKLDRPRVIPPRATVRLRVTLDVGPPRAISRQTPQQLQRVTVNAILDPEYGPKGGWQKGLSGQKLQAADLARQPADTDRDALQALFKALSGDADPPRWRALETLAELLGEKHRADAGKLNYHPEPIPADGIHAALLAMLRSDSWEARVRALDALQQVGLDRALLEAVEQNLQHPHWLVRIMALRQLARQGPAFAERAQAVAKADSDELVRALAAAYAESLRSAPAASQPAGAK